MPRPYLRSPIGCGCCLLWPGRSHLGRPSSRGLGDLGIDSGADIAGTNRTRRGGRPPGWLPRRRCGHLLEVRHTPKLICSTFRLELRGRRSQPVALASSGPTPHRPQPGQPVTPLSWSPPALLTGRPQCYRSGRGWGHEPVGTADTLEPPPRVPLAVTPRSAANGRQDGAGSDSALELRLPRRSPRTVTKAPSRDLTYAAGAEATPKLRVPRATLDMALRAVPNGGAAEVAPGEIAADG
jgi:hypothetical protein